MTDEEFLKLGPAAAKTYAWQQAGDEKSRLHALYHERHKVVLEDGASTATGGTGPDAPSASYWGWGLVALGICVSGYAFGMNVGVETYSAGAYGIPSEVANIDKIAIRHMTLATGLALFVSGTILSGLNAVRAALTK